VTSSNYRQQRSPVRFERTAINESDAVLAIRYRVGDPYCALYKSKSGIKNTFYRSN